jgi:DNA-binding transcriptional regulator LsrR (DeoR family)
MQALENKENLRNINVVPLIGASNRHASEYQLSEIVRMFAEKLSGIPSYLHAPAIAETIEDQNLYMKSSDMQAIIKKWMHLDFAIISAGATPEYYFSSLKPDAKHMLEIIKNSPDRAVGDICGRRYNLDGEFLNNDYNRRVIAINENSLRNAENVICVAAGEHKVFSIIGALRTALVHYLVVDENAALKVKDIIEN